ncbi:MAG: GldG family protein, partial [Hyphomicrobiales bacterium]|nr:GldG family protein [Hyphomicrobiales bacterium]
ESEPSVPVAIKSYARRVLDRLKVIASHSNGRISVNVVDPRPDSDQELAALGAGIQRIPMTSGDYFYLGLTASLADRTGQTAYLDRRRQQLLDYDLALLLSNLGRTATRKLGIVSPLVTPKDTEAGRPGLRVLEEFKRAYDVAVIPHFDAALPDGLDVLLVMDATILKKQMLYAIDQFVMEGGGLVVLIDPQLRANKASNAVNPDPSPEINDISDLLLSYGVRYRGGDVVGDAGLAASVMDGQQNQSAYPFWLRVPQDQVAKSHPVTADLNELLFAEAAALELTPGSPAVPLITTTAQSGTRNRKGFDDLTPAQLASEFNIDGQSRIIAATIASPLESAFNNDEMSKQASNHVSASTSTPAVFAVGDIDWIFDPFALQQVDAGGQAALRPLNDNLTFLLNMLEYAGGEPSLIAIRSRGKLHRPFSHVAELFKAAQARFRDKEAELAGRIAQVEAELAKIPKAAGKTGFQALPDELKSKIAEVQSGLLPMRRELRALRLSMRETVDRLTRRLTIANLVAGPVLVLLFAGACAVRRKRWQRR